MEHKIKHKGKQKRNTSVLYFFHKIGKNSKSGATRTNEAEASTKMVDSDKALPAAPAAAIARGKLRTRSCEGMFLKPHKLKLSELLFYCIKYSAHVELYKKIQDKYGVNIIQLFAIDFTKQGLIHTSKRNGGVRCEKCETSRQLPCTKSSLRQQRNATPLIKEWRHYFLHPG